MRLEEITEVCRLCLKKENLVWIFDKQLEYTENLKDVISLTTGVEIDFKDLVSQKICKKCMGIVRKMKLFRELSLENDILLKEKYKEIIMNGGVKIANTSITIKKDGLNDLIERKLSATVMHPSVKRIFKEYPKIKLPKNCVKVDVAPCVSMAMNEVEIYFRQRNLDMTKHLNNVIKSLQCVKKAVTEKTSEEKAKIVHESLSKTSVDHKKPVKQNPISPISIKLTNPEKTQYKIVKNDEEALRNKIKCDLKRKIVSTDSNLVCSSSSTTKKRKISESSTSSEKKENSSFNKRISETSTSSEKKENKKPNLIESLGLTPTNNKSKTENESPVQFSYVERTLAICDICNSVQYSLKELKRHKLKHLRCQFCRTKFKTMALKEGHIKDSCIIKKTMNSLPDVEVEKVEYDLEIRRKYPDAFTSFPLIPELIVENNSGENTEKDQSDLVHNTAYADNKCTSTSTSEKPANANDNIELKTTNADLDIIEILSDDDESTAIEKKTISSDDTSKDKELDEVSTNPPQTSQSGLTHPSTNKTEQQNPTKINNEINPSTSIVKPDIRIKNSSILETIDPKATDLMVLKELLKNYKQLLLSKDTATQPELPSNTSITTNVNDFTATLKNFKSHLYVYRIPVLIKNGTYKVSFDYTPTEKKTRKMLGWNHLNPIDLKTPVNQVTVSRNIGAVPNQQPIVTAYTGPNLADNGVMSLQTSISSTPAPPRCYSDPSQNQAVINLIDDESNITQPAQVVLTSNADKTATAISTGTSSNQQVTVTNPVYGIPLINTYNNQKNPVANTNKFVVQRSYSVHSVQQTKLSNPADRNQVKNRYNVTQIMPTAKTINGVIQRSYSTPANPQTIVSKSVDRNHVDGAFSNFLQTPAAASTSYNSAAHLTSSSNSVSNNIQPAVQAPTPLTTQQNGVTVRFSGTLLTNSGHNLSNTTHVISSVGVPYNSNNIYVQQNSTLSTPTQLTYQTNPPSSVSYVPYNGNAMYNNTNTTMVIPNSAPQYINPSHPVISNMLNSNYVESERVLPTTSSVLFTTLVSSSVSTPLSSVSVSKPLNSSTVGSSTYLGTTSVAAPILSVQSSLSNVGNEFSNVSLNNNVLDHQNSTSTMPCIRVKNLFDLK